MNWDPTPVQRRLLFACVVALLTAVGIYLTAPELFGGRDAESGPTGGAAAPHTERPVADGTSAEAGVDPTATPVPSELSPVPAPSPSPSEVQAPYVRKALRFARAFTNTDISGAAWHTAVARHTTTDLGEALSYTDPNMVPQGRPVGDAEVRTTGETVVEVAVPLDTGAELLVTVTPAKGGYAVSSVSPGDTT